MWPGAEIRISLPKERESAAVSDMPKLAALCYDRVHGFKEENSTSMYYVPEPIRFSGATETELQLSAFSDYGEVINSWIKSMLLGGTSVEEAVKKLKKDVPREAATHSLRLVRNCFAERLGLDEFFELIQKRMAKEFTRAYGIPVVPIFRSSGISNGPYIKGKREAVFMTLRNLRIPDEKHLEWGQVLEFRNDAEARKKYRKLLYWLDKEMIDKPQSFVGESIAIKLDEYEKAMKKHGIKTVLSTVEQTLDGRLLMEASTAAGALTVAGHPTLGVLAGAGLIIGKTAVQLARAKISFDDVEVGLNSEISWVYEVKQLGN